MRVLILLLTLLLSPFLQAERLNIGTLVYDPPFEVEADKKEHFFGFDVDIMMEVCNRLHADCHFTPLLFLKFFQTY
ncbi:lysine-arginine-ornithine-binding periplasmic protein [Legionella massiliensis]|uniref:Lysine-arginine-ornithine-binding periplasmic protein n=1 Tax=Legionella massiliensis TaxID=1034943 RepID=A0A078KSY6_9GAMM|nr:transporter substrate-binding domain-containing protein [Legionella massiliensis]CDZ76067.1 lysine-arginine-ornithine-binding periplasmic protein [Legionella massiliensis]CEE11805.1 hypothetical protein BN1094_00331 [Legionella massiliensis]